MYTKWGIKTVIILACNKNMRQAVLETQEDNFVWLSKKCGSTCSFLEPNKKKKDVN